MHSNEERTLGIIKPDAWKRKLVGEVIKHIMTHDFNIVAMKLIHISKKDAARFYEMHRNKHFYHSLLEFMSSGPSVVMVLSGFRVIHRFREVMGATDPAKAAYGTIRRLYGTSIERNIVHGSDSLKSAKREIAFFFSPEEFVIN